MLCVSWFVCQSFYLIAADECFEISGTVRIWNKEPLGWCWNDLMYLMIVLFYCTFVAASTQYKHKVNSHIRFFCTAAVTSSQHEIHDA